MKKLLDLWNYTWVGGFAFILILLVILFIIEIAVAGPPQSISVLNILELLIILLVIGFGVGPGLIVFVAGVLSGLPIGLGIKKILFRKKNDSLAPGIILLILGVGLFVSSLFILIVLTLSLLMQ